MTETTPRPDGHVQHGGPILDRHDYRNWVEVDPERQGIPHGTRVRQEWVMGGLAGPRRTFIHPDDVPTDPDAELVERVGEYLAAWAAIGVTDGVRLHARSLVALVRDYDKADR